MKNSTNGDAERFFVDTNVLLYAVDPVDAVKHRRAKEWVATLWESGQARISWQVIHEYYSNAIRKLKHPPNQARFDVASFVQWEPTGFSFDLLQRGWYWTDHAQVSFWDSLILASAEAAHCSYLLSEDFQSGREFGTVTVVNPFQHAPAEFLG